MSSPIRVTCPVCKVESNIYAYEAKAIIPNMSHRHYMEYLCSGCDKFVVKNVPSTITLTLAALGAESVFTDDYQYDSIQYIQIMLDLLPEFFKDEMVLWADLEINS
jgi:hypothetical protein